MIKYKVIEFIGIFLLLPLIFLFNILPSYFIMIVLWLVSIYALITLKEVNPFTFFDRSKFKDLKIIFIRFLLILPILFLFTYLFYNELLFNFLINEPKIFLLVLIIYPLLSVIPQEIIFRKFFFERYNLKIEKSYLIIINAIIFGWVHIVFENYIAVIFSIIGGYLFAKTFQDTKSFTLVCIEHSLYGNLLFTLGLGEFFYHANN